MRLTPFEIITLKNSTQKYFGSQARIFLFGSRVDDSKRGGDIDLYIIADHAKATQEQKIKFLVELQLQLGEQKIDVVLAQDRNRPIEQVALTNGIEL